MGVTKRWSKRVREGGGRGAGSLGATGGGGRSVGVRKRWSKRVRALVRRDDVERELDEELAFHLEMETEKNVRSGMTPAEARRQAVLEFGGVEKHKEEVRDARWLGGLNGLSLDTRLGARM